jgi:hypothetical protein
VTRLMSGQSRVRIPAEATDLSLPPYDKAGSGAHTSFCSMGAGVFLPGVRRSGREADASRPYDVEVKNISIYIFMENAETIVLYFTYYLWRVPTCPEHIICRQM